MVYWLWHTDVQIDGEKNGRHGNLTCVSESGSITSTAEVMEHWDLHWRSCLGPKIFTVSITLFLIQVGQINVISYKCSWSIILNSYRFSQQIKYLHFRINSDLLCVTDDVHPHDLPYLPIMDIHSLHHQVHQALHISLPTARLCLWRVSCVLQHGPWCHMVLYTAVSHVTTVSEEHEDFTGWWGVDWCG